MYLSPFSASLFICVLRGLLDLLRSFGHSRFDFLSIVFRRILDLFPSGMHGAIRATLAFNLKAIIAQKLVKTSPEWEAKGIDRVPINEILLLNPSVKKAIATDQDERLADILKVAESEGMQDFTKALVERVESEMITREAAFEVAPSPDALKMALKGIKMPVSGLI